MAYTENYTKQTWEDLPEQTTPLSAERLNHIEDGVKTNDTRIVSLSSDLEDAESSIANLSTDMSNKLNKNNPTGTGAMSMNRAANSGIGNNSVAEGDGCTASGAASHAEGSQTKATSSQSHAEGYQSEANGTQSHAEGYMSKADGYVAHAEGYEVKASGTMQHVQGRYNIEDSQGTYAHIVGGGGSDSSRANIHTLDWSGNAIFAGNVTDGNGDSIASLKALVETLSGGGITIEVVAALPTENISTTTIYFVPASSAETGDYYDEYMYVNSTWELLGNTSVDLSDYYTKEEAAAEFVAKVTGKGLSTNDYTTEEKDKLGNISTGATKVEDSTSNGNIKINGTETEVYAHPTGEGNEHIPAGGTEGQVLEKTDNGYGWSNKQDISGKLDKTGDASNVTNAFTQASSRTNLSTGEKLAISLGKIKKWFADLKTVAFTGSYADLSNTPNIPTNTSDLTNDSDFVSDANYVHTDNNFDATYKGNVDSNTSARHSHSNKSILDAITAAFTTALKTKLDGIATGANKTVVDTTFSDVSTNPATSTAIAAWVEQRIASGGLNKEIVESLPVPPDIDTNTIYMVLRTAATENDIYNEYLNFDGTSSGWELIGSSAADLSDYYTKAQANTLFSFSADVGSKADLTTTEKGTVVGAINELNDSLNAGAEHFYFDYKDGKYGYNTSAARGADTFAPFCAVEKIELFQDGVFKNTDICTVKCNATLSGDKLVSTGLSYGFWINTFNLTDREKYVFVAEFTAMPSNSQIGYCTTGASLPSIVASGTGRIVYYKAHSVVISDGLSTQYGNFVTYIGSVESIYLLKVK